MEDVVSAWKYQQRTDTTAKKMKEESNTSTNSGKTDAEIAAEKAAKETAAVQDQIDSVNEQGVDNNPTSFIDPLGLCSESTMEEDEAQSFIEKNLNILDSLNNKDPGEELTEDESKMQIALGSLEVAGGVAMFGTSVALASPAGIVPSTYIMADGSNRISKGMNGEKAEDLLPAFISPITTVGDETYAVPGI